MPVGWLEIKKPANEVCGQPRRNVTRGVNRATTGTNVASHFAAPKPSVPHILKFGYVTRMAPEPVVQRTMHIPQFMSNRWISGCE